MYHIHIKYLKYGLIFLTSLAISRASLYAQSAVAPTGRVIDSLTLLLGEKTGLDRFDVLYDLTFEYIGSSDFENSLHYADEALLVSQQYGDSLRMVKSSRVKAQILRRLDKTTEAIEVFQNVLNIAKRNDYASEVKLVLNSLAVAYTFQAEYSEALNYHFQSLLIRQKEGNKAEMSQTYNNIGLVYFKLKNYDKALEYYDQALVLENSIPDSNFKDRLLINIGLCYNQIKKYDDAQKYINKGLTNCSPNCNTFTIIEGEFGLGVSFFGLKQYEESVKHFSKSYETSIDTDDKRFQLENLVYLAKIYTALEKAEVAEKYLKQAESLASGTSYNQLLIDIFRAYSVLYNQTKDFQHAALYQSKYILLKDSLFNEELIKKIAKVQTNFEERKNIATIAAKEEQIQRQRSLNFAIVIIAVLASLLIFVLYRSNSVKKKVNHALSEAKTIIEDQNRQLLSSNYNLDKELKEKNIDLQKANESLQRVNEELDNFIYKTSHDIRGPLASLKGMCNVALMDVHDQLALSYLRKLDITAEKLNTILTRLLIVNQINNSALGSEKIDFIGIVSDVLLLEKKKGLPPRLKIKKHIADSIEFYSDKEFVRIILENLIDNAIKFYNDSERIEPFVDIAVTEEENYVKIRVIDNGIGISEVHPDKIFQMFSRASERSETGGIGLYITKTATEKLGGSVHLKTSPEGYTEFSVRLPLIPSKVLV